MSIRFKFRSTINFDTLPLDADKPYISIGELRVKIMCLKKLYKVWQKDFDLVFSDAITGQEYNDDEFELPSGSSVIIKRVPAEPVPFDVLIYERFEASELKNGIRKGLDQNKPEKIVPEENLEPDSDKQIKLENVASVDSLDPLRADLPTELNCPLCKTIFKAAVMTQCCHRSVCEKCIRAVLVVKGSCPWCSSKCRVEDLLPNVCLRQTIKQVLQSHIFVTSEGKDMQKYAPDGESGIHGKDVSSAVPVTKRNKDLSDSTSVMNKGFDQHMGESTYNKNIYFMEGSGSHDSNAVGHLKSTSLLKIEHSDRHRDIPEDLATANCHDINQPLNIPQADKPVEGVDQRFRVDRRRKKLVDRTCYMCGSPYHFIRDCPIASNRYPMSHAGDPMFRGCTPFYSSSAAFPSINPYMNMYGSPGMMPFMPFGVPHYRPSMYSSFHVSSGTMMGGPAAPVGTRSELPLTHSEILQSQHGATNVPFARERYSDNEYGNVCHKRHHVDELQRSMEYKSTNREWGETPSNTEDQKLQREHCFDEHRKRKGTAVDGRHEEHSQSTHAGKDKMLHHTDRLSIGVNMHNRCNARHHENIQKEKGAKRKVHSDVDFQQKHRSNYSKSSSSTDERKQQKDISTGPIFRESKERTKPRVDKLYGDGDRQTTAQGSQVRTESSQKGRKEGALKQQT